jgi:hypothetical protein
MEFWGGGVRRAGNGTKLSKTGKKKKNYRQNNKREGDLHSGVCEEFSPPPRRCSKLPRDPNSEKL